MNADQTPGDQAVPHTKSQQPKKAAKSRSRATKGSGKGRKLKVQDPATEDAEAASVIISPLSDAAE
jgi:hypothetical protein